VTLSTTTLGAAIYYTLDGTTPTVTPSAAYITPIIVQPGTTLKAFAVLLDHNDSEVMREIYDLPTVATPTANPAGGAAYTEAQYVALSTTTTGATIYYTLDGTTPTTASAVYVTPILVQPGTTLKAFAVASGYIDSAVMSETYAVSVATVPPTITTETLPNCAIGVDYSAALAATGTAPITWAITSGNLPDGVTLDPDTGTLSGLPTTAETFTFTVKAENSAGTDTKEFTVTIGTPPAITTDTELKTC
jgi:hypothetical protein